jgi:hypothetical protein
MEISLEELLKGKAVKIKNKDFLPTRAYVEPFLERMSKITNDFRVQVRLPELITLNDPNEGRELENLSYTRVLVQGVLPDRWNNHSDVIGMVFGLDVRKPLIKIYKGALNHACTNLSVFDPSFLNVQFIEPEKAISYKPVEYLLEKEDDTKLMLDNLQEIIWEGTPSNIEQNLGKWIRKALTSEYDNGYGKIKIGTDVVIKAYNSVFMNNESPYYIGEGKDVDMFTVYNAFTELISHDTKDIMNGVEKTILLRQILDF